MLETFNSKERISQTINAIREERIRKELPKRLKEAEIPKRYFDATFENMAINGVPNELVRQLEKAKCYADNFKENMNNGVGVIFSGSVGRLKTTMAVAILQSVIKQGWQGYFISMPELLDKLVSFAKGDSKGRADFENKIRSVSLLVLDDMGAEYQNDWVLNKVDAIITHRYNEMLPIIITTNLRLKEIKQSYMLRVYDRLKQTSVHIYANDVNGESKSYRGIYGT